MKEKGNKRREWVKTAAIIFLAVMLVLTFFSNTIMNYSLPEVATQYVMSDTITARIRGTGTVESGDPYNVEIKESRKVASVAVKVGDEVQKGDVLLYLDGMESDELKAAQDALEEKEKLLQDARDQYNAALLNPDISAEDIQAANGNVSAAAYRQQITAAQKNIQPLEDQKKELEKQIADIDAQLTYETDLDAAAGTSVTAAESQLETTRSALEGANAAFQAAKANLDAANRELQQQTVSGNDTGAAKEKVAACQAAYTAAEANQNSAQTAYNNAVNTYNSAVANQKAREGSQTSSNLSKQKALLQVELYSVQKNLDDATKALEELVSLVTDKQSLDVLQMQIALAQRDVDEAREEVDTLLEKAQGTTVTADISGTVTAVNVTAGNTTSPGNPLVVLQPEGKGYTMSFTVTNDQARKLAVGDRADLVNAWRYDDVEVTLASKRPDPNSPGQNTLLTFDVTGLVTPGQSLSITVGQQSGNYDLVVPNSAIREDSNGKFILIVESRSTPIGTRYIATRVDVQVLASDDTKSAVSGGLYGYEYVITTATKPVDAGQQVRLTNN